MPYWASKTTLCWQDKEARQKNKLMGNGKWRMDFSAYGLRLTNVSFEL
ncbi:MAG: hypothetical protein KAU91_00315 [Candidatus Aminicenantes bacterium]|nr:hypothetical protein [Candidatus Aminicenantes bacterium]